MRKLILLTLGLMISVVLSSQKVQVQVVRETQSAGRSWQILDDNFRISFQGDYFTNDTITFSLEADSKYFFYFSSLIPSVDSVNLYSVSVNGEMIILVSSDIGEGDHFLPFFTGVRQRATKITGGSDALISEFPWQVYITAGRSACGGSIIASQWIVTAAHCVIEDGNTVLPSQVVVRAGVNNITNPSDGTTYQAEQVIVHEDYNGNTDENDIALIRLRNPITIATARPIRLVNPEDVGYGAIDPGVMGWVTGWGITSVNPKIFPTRLQKVQLPIISRTQALTVWKTIPVTDIIAGYRNGNKDACSGDSGGPLSVPVLGEYKLAGIVSWGSSQCNTYGAYTNVSLFETWVRQKTGIQPLRKPPAIAGDTLICEGEFSSRYTVAATSGISSYEWKLSPEEAGFVTGISTSAGIIWNTAFTGVASINYRFVLNGETSDWSRLRIIVAGETRLLNQSRDTALCTGQPVTLFVSAKGYNLRYTWYRDGIIVKSGADSTLTYTSPAVFNSGTYRVEIASVCRTINSGPINLTIHPLTNITRVPADTSIKFGSTHEIKINAAGHNLTYEWQKDSTVIATSTGPGLKITSANASHIGNYQVTVTGTCGTRTSRKIYLFVEGRPAVGGPDVFLWPSPVTSSFSIAIRTDEIYNVNIYNMSGSLVASFRRLRFQNSIDISHLAGGTYIVVVYNNSFRTTTRLIKL